MKTQMRSKLWMAIPVALTTAFVISGCNPQEPPIKYSITVPSPDTLKFEASLTKRYGIGLSGTFDILQYGSVTLKGETPTDNFTFGFTLHGGVFLKDTWVNFQETQALPTGALFPSWVSTAVVDVQIPALNTPPVDFNFYFGTRGQLYVGVAATIKAINEKFPELYIDYTFYDKQGRTVLGLVMYGPKKDEAGGLVQSGGVFVGSNITPFLPADVIGNLPQNPPPATKSLLPQALMLVKAAESGEPLSLKGQSLVSEIKVRGKDAHQIRTSKQLRSTVGKFLTQTQGL